MMINFDWLELGRDHSLVSLAQSDPFGENLSSDPCNCPMIRHVYENKAAPSWQLEEWSEVMLIKIPLMGFL